MNSFEQISSYALKRVVDEPIAQQIAIYKAVADLTPDLTHAQELAAMANELEAISSRQMEISFRAAARGNYRKAKR